MTNKPIYQRLLDATNDPDDRSREQALDELCAPDVAASIKEAFATLFRAFPDLHVTNDDLLEDGDKVVARQTVTGTNTGEFMGMAPTGRFVTYDEIFILRFAGGRVVELWGTVDRLSCLRQLGALSSSMPPQAGADG